MNVRLWFLRNPRLIEKAEIDVLRLWKKRPSDGHKLRSIFLANLYCFAYELTFLGSLIHSPQAQTPGSQEYQLIQGMHETSRYIDDLLTLNFPEFDEVMHCRVDEVNPPPGSGIVLLGIYPCGFQHSQANIDDDLQASQATTEPSSLQAPDNQQDEGLVLEQGGASTHSQCPLAKMVAGPDGTCSPAHQEWGCWCSRASAPERG